MDMNLQISQLNGFAVDVKQSTSQDKIRWLKRLLLIDLANRCDNVSVIFVVCFNDRQSQVKMCEAAPDKTSNNQPVWVGQVGKHHSIKPNLTYFFIMCDPSVGNTGYLLQQIKSNIVWLISIVYLVLFLMVWSV